MKKLFGRFRVFAACLSLLMLAASAKAQAIAASELPQAPTPQQGQPPASTEAPKNEHGGILSNYGSFSVNEKLPPQTVGEKFKMAAIDSFGPSTFGVRAAVAGVDEARNSIPEFHQGGAGFGRYYWHSMVDSVVETTMVEFIVPVATHEDTRYYRLGSGSVAKRTLFAVKRVFVIRCDAGNNTFNFSEIVGAGAAAGISNLYYPSRERTFDNTVESWGLNVAIDAGSFVAREFLPDVMHALFHRKEGPPPGTKAP
jgi:hypothetical protein